MIGYQNLLFDLDGTLTDPSEGIVRCYQYALQKMGEAPAPDGSIRKLIGPPLRVGFRQILQDPTPERIEEAVRAYRERFAATGVYEVKLTNNVSETLSRLKKAGKTLFVVTSKTQHFAEETLRHLEIAQHFSGVFGGDMAGALDDKADIVRNCVRSTRISHTDSVMIGDRLHDFYAVKAHGIATIGVRCGFAEAGELESLGCLTIINDISELLLPEMSNM